VKRILGILVGVTVLGAVGFGGFLAARSISDQAGGQDSGAAVGQPSPSVAEDGGATPAALTQGLEEILADSQKPAFAGDVLGIYIVPPDGSVSAPEQYVTGQDVCGPEYSSVVVPWEQAGELGLVFELSPDFTLMESDPNTGVWACNGVVVAANWTYRHEDGGQVTIGQTRLTVGGTHRVPAERVKVAVIGGREAAVFEPLYKSRENRTVPGGSESEIIFPEPFGHTFISGYDMSFNLVLGVAEAVARASK
jgi:hypothetical protein